VVGLPSVENTVEGGGGVADVDALPVEVEAERFGSAVADGEGGGGLGRVGEAVQLGKPELVRDALAAKIKTLPEVLRASLTWDQGPEMGKWKQVAVDAGCAAGTCETPPASPPGLWPPPAVKTSNCRASMWRR
jgi:hypothetical protein